MRLLDFNLLIYSAQDEYKFLRSLIRDRQTYLSAASKVETLGYHKLSTDERLYFEDIFKSATVLSITDDVVDKAVELRQQKRMSFGDSIIAATALLNGFDLYTNNTNDFIHIPGLTVVNPLNEQ
ncbi:type II toxin-antitoxin system VapC family toxin [Spirosoma arcticum]